MTAFFDKAERDFSTNGVVILSEAVAIERKVAATVVALIGDIEFPEPLRDKIIGIIAVDSICASVVLGVNHRAARWAERGDRSTMLTKLHEAFHELARSRIPTRFGILSDDPEAMLRALCGVEEGGK